MTSLAMGHESHPLAKNEVIRLPHFGQQVAGATPIFFLLLFFFLNKIKYSFIIIIF
jgi:hypothetical protein